MHRAPLLVTTALLLLGGACSSGDDEPDATASDAATSAPALAFPPARLPANLCTAVPEWVARDWKLREASHDTRTETGRAVAECELRGRYDGDAITVAVRLDSRAGTTRAEARRAMNVVVQAECDPLGAGVPQGASLWSDEDGCTLQHPGVRVIHVERSRPIRGAVVVDVAYTGPDVDGLTAGVLGISQILALGLPPTR